MKIITLFFILISFFSCTKNIAKKKEVDVKLSKTNMDTLIKITKPQYYKFDKSFILGKFDYKKDTSFINVAAKHSSKSIFLKKETYKAFVKMYNAAKTANIFLKIISGTRNFYEQKSIWNRKWTKYSKLTPLKRIEKILEFSAMPSTSRHHWGTDIDLNNLNNNYFDKGKGKKEYNWLINNAASFGFYQVYTLKNSERTGYNLEKWHWSYLPLASKYLNYYNENINYNDITGFKGAKLADSISVIKLYVNGIHKKAKLFKPN